MSLINDALRRAKEAQQDAPPPPAAQFRPVEPALRQQRSRGPLLMITIAALILVVGLLAWQLLQKQQPRQPTSQADARTQPLPTPESQIERKVSPPAAAVP